MPVFAFPIACIKRFICCLTSWRMVKSGFAALAVLACLVPMFYLAENARGKRAWDGCRRALEAKGEQLDFAHFIPPPVPDAQNFALTPVVASCYSRALDRNGHSIQPPKTNVADRLEMNLMRRQEASPSPAEMTRWWHPSAAGSTTNNPTNTVSQDATNRFYLKPSLGNWARGQLTDLLAWQFYYRLAPGTNRTSRFTNEFPVAAQVQSPAADVLLALSRYDSAVADLREASRLPLARFPLNYAINNPSGMLFPHLGSLRLCARALSLRAVAELPSGQTDQALADIRLLSRLADSIRIEPFLVSLKVRLFAIDSAIQPVWEGLAEHRWSDAELVALDRALVGCDLLWDYGLAVRGERAWALKLIDYLRTERTANSVTCMCGDIMFWPTFAARHAPDGWFYLNAQALATVYDAALPSSAETERRIISPEISRRFQRAQGVEGRRHWIPDNVLLGFLVPRIDGEAGNCAYTQASVDMARIACALERYRLAQSRYPEQLDVLAPQYLERLPHDIIDGQALHYRLGKDGRFLLYSVGWNAKDDGGTPQKWRTYLASDLNGDWVWQYPAK